jgi:hypothetical protein
MHAPAIAALPDVDPVHPCEALSKTLPLDLGRHLIPMDDSTFPAVLTALHQGLAELAAWLCEAPDLDPDSAETMTVERIRR